MPISNLDTPILLDTILAYPDYPNSLHDLLSRVFASPASTFLDDIRSIIIPSLVERLNLHPGAPSLWVASTTIWSLLRAHEELLALLLSEADFLIPALRDAYSAISSAGGAEGGDADGEAILAKASVLMIVRALEGSVGGMAKEGMRRLIHGPPGLLGAEGAGKGGSFLLVNTLGQDFDLLSSSVFSGEGGGGVSEGVMEVLEGMRDTVARGDPVRPFSTLFCSHATTRRWRERG